MVWYIDTSALTKFITTEEGSEDLRVMTRDLTLATSQLAVVELSRATRRYSEESARRAETLLGTLNLVLLDRPVLLLAASISPPELRSIDAIHVATALHLGPDCEGIITY